jgi:pyruvate-formate lyase-activating enzyme
VEELSPPGATDRTPDATARKDAPVDRLGRRLRDLRVSVTDRCNFRCPYCMPKEVFGRSYAFLARAEILSFEEITRVVGAAASLGVTKVRLTGGEPLLRRELDTLVAMLSEVEGITDLALTTNGALLAGKAHGLRAAGLARVTVSLDSLDEAVFAAMNDVGVPLGRVLDGIAAALDAGFRPVKLNTVVKRGVNDDGLVELAQFARARPDRAVHRVHGRRHHQRVEAGRRRACRRDRPADRRGAAAGAGRGELPWGGRPPLALPRRLRRDRRDRLGDPAVLLWLHPRATVDRRQAVHLPVRRGRA